MISKMSFEQLEKEFKSQDFSLITFDTGEIKIKKLSKITIFTIMIMSVVGIIFFILSYVSIFSLENPEYFAGFALFIVGVIIVLIPIYNLFSKRFFEINFNKKSRSVTIKKLDPLPVRSLIPFDDIHTFQLKKTALNSYVSDKTKGSYLYVYGLSLILKNNDRKEFINFSRRDELIEDFSINLTNHLIEFTGLNKEMQLVS
jgi:hypothetical protein